MDHTHDMFKQLSTMTQLTHLRFSSINRHLKYQQLCQLLLHWTALTNLSALQCCFEWSCENRDLDPVVCKDGLKAIMTQRPNMHANISIDFMWFEAHSMKFVSTEECVD